MGDWIGLGVIVLVLAGVVLGLASLGRPRARISEEEFERRVQEGGGMLSAGVMGLQQILEPGAKRAVEVQQDLRAGHYNGQQEQGEGDGESPVAGEFESKADAGVREPPATEERDAET